MRPRADHDLTPYGLALCAGVAVCIVVIAATTSAHAASEYTADDTFEAINQASMDTGIASSRLIRIVSCETGGTFSPTAEGDRGHSHGAVQLNDYGALHTFLNEYTDPYNPYEAVHFLAEVLRGDHPGLGAWTWSCR